MLSLRRNWLRMSPGGAIIAIAVLWYVFGTGNLWQKNKAVDKVKNYRLPIATAEGTKDLTVAQLVCNYDPDTGTLQTGSIPKLKSQQLSWQASYVTGKFSVGCETNGRLYSFETDLINVTPVSDAAQLIFGMKQAGGRLSTGTPSQAPEYSNASLAAKRHRAMWDERMLSTAIDMYVADNGRPPTTEQGLQALLRLPIAGPQAKNWNGPYLRKGIPKDPWGRNYIYTSPGRHKVDYDIVSYGGDGREGGVGGDADIASWDE